MILKCKQFIANNVFFFFKSRIYSCSILYRLHLAAHAKYTLYFFLSKSLQKYIRGYLHFDEFRLRRQMISSTTQTIMETRTSVAATITTRISRSPFNRRYHGKLPDSNRKKKQNLDHHFYNNNIIITFIKMRFKEEEYMESSDKTLR